MPTPLPLRTGPNVDHASTVHVGHLEPTDVAGAKAAGMRSVRIVHEGADPATAADASINNLADVLDVLRRWGLEC